jgi:hypothetical protein
MAYFKAFSMNSPAEAEKKTHKNSVSKAGYTVEPKSFRERHLEIYS